MHTVSTRRAIFSLMLVLFIDGMGQGIIFPILTSTVTDPHSTVLLFHISQHVRDVWYGILIGAYYFMWFLGAAVLGDWSDKVGRKKALVVCLSLAAISFALSAFSFDLHSILLLLISRFLGGLTSGDQAIAQAAIIDLCDPKKKAIYLGLVLFAVTLGLVVGPLIGALLQNSNFVSWFTVKTPFYFAALIAILNIILLWRFFEETHPVKVEVKLQWTRALHVFVEALRYRPIRLLLLAYLFGQMGWAMFYVVAPYFVIAKYHVSSLTSAWFLAVMGIGIGIGLGVLPSMAKSFSNKYVAAFSYSFIAISSLIFIIVDRMLILWFFIVPITALIALGFANILPLFSEAVSESRQGWIMGVTGSIVALTAGIDSLISGFLSSINISMPYVFAIVVTTIGVLFLINYRIGLDPCYPARGGKLLSQGQQGE